MLIHLKESLHKRGIKVPPRHLTSLPPHPNTPPQVPGWLDTPPAPQPAAFLGMLRELAMLWSVVILCQSKQVWGSWFYSNPAPDCYPNIYTLPQRRGHGQGGLWGYSASSKGPVTDVPSQETHAQHCLDEPPSPWRQTSENGNTTQAGGKPGKLPTPWQHKKWESQSTTDERLSLVHQPQCWRELHLKKINQNDLQEACGDQESNWLSEWWSRHWARSNGMAPLGDTDQIILRFSWADSPVLTSSALCKARWSKVHYF